MRKAPVLFFAVKKYAQLNPLLPVLSAGLLWVLGQSFRGPCCWLPPFSGALRCARFSILPLAGTSETGFLAQGQPICCLPCRSLSGTATRFPCLFSSRSISVKNFYAPRLRVSQSYNRQGKWNPIISVQVTQMFPQGPIPTHPLTFWLRFRNVGGGASRQQQHRDFRSHCCDEAIFARWTACPDQQCCRPNCRERKMGICRFNYFLFLARKWLLYSQTDLVIIGLCFILFISKPCTYQNACTFLSKIFK